MVVGTHIVVKVILTVIPLRYLLIGSHSLYRMMLGLGAYLRKNPASGDDCVSFEKLYRCRCIHFRSDHRTQIFLNRQMVDRDFLSVGFLYFQ